MSAVNFISDVEGVNYQLDQPCGAKLLHYSKMCFLGRRLERSPSLRSFVASIGSRTLPGSPVLNHLLGFDDLIVGHALNH